jgi:hypothetical protein
VKRVGPCCKAVGLELLDFCDVVPGIVSGRFGQGVVAEIVGLCFVVVGDDLGE